MSGGQDEAAEQIETSGSGRAVQRVVLDEATGRYFACASDGRALCNATGRPILFAEPAAAFIALSMEEAAANLRASGLPVVDPLALLDQAQATEKKLRQQVDEMQSLLSRIRKIICDFGVAREPQECIEAWLQRSLMAPGVNIEKAVDGIIESWDDWEAEACQAAQLEQSDDAWMFYMRTAITDCIHGSCKP